MTKYAVSLACIIVRLLAIQPSPLLLFIDPLSMPQEMEKIMSLSKSH